LDHGFHNEKGRKRIAAQKTLILIARKTYLIKRKRGRIWPRIWGEGLLKADPKKMYFFWEQSRGEEKFLGRKKGIISKKRPLKRYSRTVV